MNTSLENLTHKMQRAAVGKMVDVVLSHADKDPEKTMGQIVDLAKQFYGSSFSDETYERAKKTLSDPDSKWSKLINCVLDQTDPHVARTMALNLGYEAFFRGTKTIRENRVKYQCNVPWLILFDPTSACNMHCVGCWAGEYGHKNNLSFEDMDKIITQGKELGVYLYMLTGGEPLVRKKETLDGLIRNYQADTVLREGVDCAIVGRPNAGKSTLLNLLAGFDRAIVTPVAGTTRDVVEQAVQLGDIRLNLFDTAGLRETEDAIEAEGIRRSWKKLEEAGLILAVFDGSEPPTREDLELARRCAGRPAIALVNKEDKPTQFDAELIAPYFAMVLPVCCQEEGSRKVIAAAVARLLGTSQIDPHAASLSGQRQLSAALRARDAVTGAREAVEAGFGLDAVSVCVDDALDALCELTGENASEAVIEQVFERFCVGK